MLPLLQLAADEQEHSVREAADYISERFRLTPEDLDTRIPSGTQLLIHNRVGWAKTYLKKAGLITQPRRGYFIISKLGLEVLNRQPEAITPSFLSQFDSFNDFFTKNPEANETIVDRAQTQEEDSPDEKLYNHFRFLRKQSKDELLELLMAAEPVVLENVVIELMRAMGFGDSQEDAAKAIGKTNDRGVDGVIHMDRLGLDRVYLQAKRYQNSVGSPEIRNFGGALDQHKANKGVFITTSTFTSEAKLCAKEMSRQIVLIDGDKLSELMLTYNIGAKPKDTLVIHDIDASYFEAF
jgi:restriction system protein